jgi:hypothetical protein
LADPLREVGDMGVTLKAGVQAGRDPDFALEIGSLMAPFQYYELQSLKLVVAGGKCKLLWKEPLKQRHFLV